MQRLTLRCTLALSAVLAVGCVQNEPYATLECTWQDEDEQGNPILKTSRWCYHAPGACKDSAPSAQAWCAWNQFTSQAADDISRFSPPGSAKLEWQATSCFGDGEYEQSKDFPPYPGHPSNACFDDPVDSGGSGASSATEPTTSGGEPTTSAGTSDTGGPEDNIYLCSLQSPWKCADLDPDTALTNIEMYDPDPYADPNIPLHTTWDACWSAVDPDESPKLSKCVEAASDLAARNGCQNWCDNYKEALEKACEDDIDCSVVKSIDCGLDGTYTNKDGMQIMGDLEGEQPVKLSQSPGWACDGEPVKVGEGPTALFEGSASFVTPEGTTAGIGKLRGFLGYELSDCSLLKCTVTIHTLIGLTSAAEGGYTDCEGMGGVFEIQGMGFQMTAPISGVWNRLLKKVTFPEDVMRTQFWANEVLVDGVPVTPGYGAYTAEIDDITGRLLTREGPLRLKLSLDLWDSGTVSVSLRTVGSD